MPGMVELAPAFKGTSELHRAKKLLSLQWCLESKISKSSYMRSSSSSSKRELLSRHLKSCTDPKSLAQLHSVLLKSGLLTAPDCFLATKLAAAYGNLASPSTARQLFDEIPNPNTHLSNAVLRSHSRSHQWHQALLLFKRVANPDPFTFPIALRASANLLDLRLGRALHGLAIKNRYARSDVFVGSALVEFYAKCGVMGDAVKVFDGFREPDVVLWTSVVTGFQRNGETEEAVSFFSRMVVGNMVVPDPVTVVSLVSAIEQLGDLRAAKCCHGYVTRMQLGLKNLSVVNSVLNLYSKLGAVQSAAKLFDVMGERDLICWSCMITCYAHNGMATEALGVYRRMVEMGLEPNEVTAVSIIQACTLALDLQEGRRMHEVAIQKGFELEAAVSTSLIDMYMKCGCYSDAIDLFNRMPKKDAVSWAAVIGGSAQNGFANESLKLFITMLSNGVRPDAVTMVKVLAACSQLGMLRQAHCFHNYSVRSGFDSQPFVGAALVDLYSRCGSLDEAVQVFDSISEKDVVLWSSMIAGYGIHGHARKAIDTFNWMVESSVRPNSVIFVSVLSACSHAGLVEEGKTIFNSMSRVYELTPNSEHCGIIVDLLGRNGELSEAMKLIEGGSSAVGPHVWCALLAGCRTHNNVEIGKVVAKNLLDVEPNHAGYYNLLSNLYAFDGRWSDVAEVRGLMKERGLRKTPGFSSIEVANKVHTFLAGERWHGEWERICEVLKRLEVKMRGEGCVANDVRLCENYGTL